MPLEAIKSKLANLKAFSFEAEISAIISENTDIILWLLQSQLSKGLDGEGSPVTIYGKPFYSGFTVQEKLKYGSGLGKEVGWITNYMSGAFYNSMYVVVEGDNIRVLSGIDYFPEIIKQSGIRIMKLSSPSLRIFREEVLLPQLRQRIKAYGL